MGRKRSKRIQIPKNRDIEEMVYQDKEEEKIESMEQVLEIIERNEEKRKIEFPQQYVLSEEVKKVIEKRVQNYIKRKDAEKADFERKQEYIKAMNKLEEKEQEER